MNRGRIIPALLVLGALALAVGLYVYHKIPAWRVGGVLDSFKPQKTSVRTRVEYLPAGPHAPGASGKDLFPRPKLVERLVQDLVRIGPRAFGRLCDELKGPDPDLRCLSAAALAEIGGQRAVKPLIDALNDDSPVVRQWAIAALVQIGDPGAVEPIVAALTDESTYVRQAAATALGALADPRAIGPLIEAVKDPDGDVRAAAAEALKRLRSR